MSSVVCINLIVSLISFSISFVLNGMERNVIGKKYLHFIGYIRLLRPG